MYSQRVKKGGNETVGGSVAGRTIRQQQSSGTVRQRGSKAARE
jgi:hypothetical protein